ncbi:MAG: ethanolamine utilization protein EutN/carboxysome structural protein CcmL [Verrucomicrobia bacterium]|nr:ethanolamine utilization protein EutN/carboxysome structural protein CcmL [Verrucomicrobiota bacterium]
MRLGNVIGHVTLSRQEASYRGGRFLLVQPWNAANYSGDDKPQASESTLVVYDQLGAGVGSIVGFTEGSEAAKPFPESTPVDAYCAAIVDKVFHQLPK